MLFKLVAFVSVALSTLNVWAKVTAENVVQDRNIVAMKSAEFAERATSQKIDSNGDIDAFLSDLVDTISTGNTAIENPKDTHSLDNDQSYIRDSMITRAGNELKESMFELMVVAVESIDDEPGPDMVAKIDAILSQ